MRKTEPLEYGNYYHIYNRGINSCNLFEEATNYQHFIRLYEQYITPVAKTYSWVLMKNHFHFLVRIKDKSEFSGQEGDNTIEDTNLPKPHLHFSNLFNAYAKAFNKRYSRHGSLFERPFKRIVILDEEYLKQVVIYIHNNPVHHGIVKNIIDYPWSSYMSCFSDNPITIQSNSVIKWFKDDVSFKRIHTSKNNLSINDEWLGI